MRFTKVKFWGQGHSREEWGVNRRRLRNASPGNKEKPNGMARSGLQPVSIFSLFFPPHPTICFLLSYDNFLLHFGNLTTHEVPWVSGQESTPSQWSWIYSLSVSWSLQVLNWTGRCRLAKDKDVGHRKHLWGSGVFQTLVCSECWLRADILGKRQRKSEPKFFVISD